MSCARIRRLYYGAADPKGGAVDSGVRFFAADTCHHRPEVYGGVNESDAAALLKDFFAARRWPFPSPSTSRMYPTCATQLVPISGKPEIGWERGRKLPTSSLFRVHSCRYRGGRNLPAS